MSFFLSLRTPLGLAVALVATLLSGCQVTDKAQAELHVDKAVAAWDAGDRPTLEREAHAAGEILPPGAADLHAKLAGALLEAATEDSRQASGKKYYLLGRKHMRQALRIRPHATQWRYALGLTALRLGDGPTAVKELGRTRRELPSDDRVRLLLARAYLDVGDYRAADDLLIEQAKFGFESERLELRGLALLLAGEAQEAATVLVRAFAADRSSARIAFNLGLAYEAGGEVGRAQLYYSRALEREPKHKKARERLALLPKPAS